MRRPRINFSKLRPRKAPVVRAAKAIGTGTARSTRAVGRFAKRHWREGVVLGTAAGVGVALNAIVGVKKMHAPKYVSPKGTIARSEEFTKPIGDFFISGKTRETKAIPQKSAGKKIVMKRTITEMDSIPAEAPRPQIFEPRAPAFNERPRIVRIGEKTKLVTRLPNLSFFKPSPNDSTQLFYKGFRAFVPGRERANIPAQWTMRKTRNVRIKGDKIEISDRFIVQTGKLTEDPKKMKLTTVRDTLGIENFGDFYEATLAAIGISRQKEGKPIPAYMRKAVEAYGDLVQGKAERIGKAFKGREDIDAAIGVEGSGEILFMSFSVPDFEKAEAILKSIDIGNTARFNKAQTEKALRLQYQQSARDTLKRYRR